MAIAFRPAPTQPPPLEHVLWRVTKDTRCAEARLRLMAHGHEFRVTVIDPAKQNGQLQLFFSRLFREGESQALSVESTGTLQNFTGHGWVLEAEKPTS
jgi:hypothetical protein